MARRSGLLVAKFRREMAPEIGYGERSLSGGCWAGTLASIATLAALAALGRRAIGRLGEGTARR